nr:hypothetical protein [Tanacetum cinerariifolium]
YIPGPEEPEQAPPSPDYVPCPEHADDEIVVEDQLYAEDASSIAQSPEYVPESDFKAHPEDDDDEDPEEDHVDYLADGGDDDDDEEGSSKDDKDDDMDIEVNEEEEEHPAPADSVAVASTAADQAPSAEETKPFETDESAATPPPHPAYRMTARISIPAPIPVPAWSDSEVVRLLAMSSSPASPLSHWSSPPPRIPFPPLPPILSPPSPMLSPAPPPSPIRSLGYRAATIRLRDEATSTSSPPLQLPSASCREDRPELEVLGQTTALLPRWIERSCVIQREVGYGITDSWDEMVETLQGAPVSTDMELGGYIKEFETRARQDTDEIYIRLDDEQTERHLLAGRLNMLFRDRHASDLVRGEVMSLRTIVLGQMTEIRKLHVANCRRQTLILELLRTDHRRSTEITELRTALQGQQQMAPKRTTRSTTDQETINATTVTNAQLQAMIDQGVTTTLAARDALRSTNGDDSHNFGTGALKEMPVFPNGLKEWSLSFISATAIPLVMKLLTDLKVKGTDLASYTQRYQELALLCGRMFSEESDKIEKYIGGRPDMIHGSVVASKPKMMQEAIEIATEMMDKKIRTFAKRETTSKRKFKNTSRNTQNQQQKSNKRQNTGQVYTVASGEKKQYEVSKPLCAKCNYHHDGPCAPKCRNCNKIGHFARDCRSAANTNNANNQRGTGLGQKTTCYECGV